MDCALKCIRYLRKEVDFDVEGLLGELEGYLTPLGISMYDMIQVSARHGLLLKGYKGWKLPSAPAILYLWAFKGGHYVVLLKKERWTLTLFDGENDVVCVNRLRFYFFYSRRYLVCYNKKK